MRKLCISLLLCLLALVIKPAATQAQFSYVDYYCLKTNPLSIGAGNFNLAYEAISDQTGYVLGLGFIKNEPIEGNSTGEGFEHLITKGVQLRLEQRFYISAGDFDAPTAPYIAFGQRILLASMDYVFAPDNFPPGTVMEQEGLLNVNSISLHGGFQYVYRERFLIEAFAGPSYNFTYMDFNFYDSPREDFDPQFRKYFLAPGLGINIGAGIGIIFE